MSKHFATRLYVAVTDLGLGRVVLGRHHQVVERVLTATIHPSHITDVITKEGARRPCTGPLHARTAAYAIYGGPRMTVAWTIERA